ncbi:MULTISPECIES: hypothetical protein [Sphingomonas]|jgi:hypothetical protein|uniref:Uncharacterized protein n=1 Tax=Sphingomonas abaci TaxID=237611 RepID=A0A7W7ALE1_9SPHN|nr:MULTISPECIES: hypothetical protein [Sphingomonas]ATI56836.1 hypothetical protein CP552_14465 [Sphingomonas melonis]MBB4619180.1 hypothetical protein [Sphingomonas abaci]MBX8846474.1 hypothetical protein [Sphingomonas melonis]MBX8855576.1 hypothetical protein [Sphingomonas melonis]MBX8900585.1 hypothetical protein [Sphingomonas melonis]
MHRVHYFATSADAFDACFETHPGLAEGDVIVALAEGVVGLASVYPIAVTRQGGALHHMPAMTREVLLGEIVHDAAQITNAVETALVHRLPVEPHYLPFASRRHILRAGEAAVALRPDDILAVADAIDHRLRALRTRLDGAVPDSSQALFLERGIAQLAEARDRLAAYARDPR